MKTDKELLDWMVVGAGPAGIAVVGKLLDAGIPAARMGWMDPHFQVGDLGRKWLHVSSNTKAGLFLRFLQDCAAFDYKKSPQKFALDRLNPEETCLLKEIALPLQWVTDHLVKKVNKCKETAIALNYAQNRWEIKTASGSFFAKNVVLAIGSDPKKLNYPGVEEIPLDIALDRDQLAKTLQPKQTIGVFGSSHSALIVLANLVDLQAHKIINFYRSPLLYALYLDKWILFDNTGLKGYAADWAKQNLDGKLPPNLQRLLVTDHTFEESLMQCNKVIYAVGFERRGLPVLEQYDGLNYNDKTGIIAPGLFGLGIAFPQAQFDPLGNLEYRVGLWKFMDYLNTILPIWLKYQ